MSLRSFILAGGQGSRLWPASRAERPKQFLPLLGGRTLILETFERVQPLSPEADPVIVSVAAHDALVADALPGLARDRIWLEPTGRNTGPSVTWVLHELGDAGADAVAVFFPSDHHVAKPAALRATVDEAAAVARRTGRIALLGARPERPETGYGYIEIGSTVAGEACHVTRFLEKPDAATAAELFRRDDMLWNCGIFVIPVAAGRQRVRDVSPELAGFMDRLPAPGTARRADGLGRDALSEAFMSVPAVPFDKAVLECVDDCLVVPLDAGWSDLGSWQAVWEASTRDENDNRAPAATTLVDVAGCLVQSDGPRVAALGVRDLVIVAWGGSVLVCSRDRAQEIRRIAATPPAADGRGEES